MNTTDAIMANRVGIISDARADLSRTSARGSSSIEHGHSRR